MKGGFALRGASAWPPPGVNALVSPGGVVAADLGLHSRGVLAARTICAPCVRPCPPCRRSRVLRRRSYNDAGVLRIVCAPARKRALRPGTLPERLWDRGARFEPPHLRFSPKV